MKTTKTKKSKKKSVLNPVGNLGIEHAAEFKEQLSSALESYQHVVINLEKVENLHLSILQIIHSAFTSNLNNVLTLQGYENENIKNALRANGLAWFTDDSPMNDKYIFWKTGAIQ